MNRRRVVGIQQELAEAYARVGVLHRELADAMAEEPAKRPRARRTVQPSAEVPTDLVKSTRRRLRAMGARV